MASQPTLRVLQEKLKLWKQTNKQNIFIPFASARCLLHWVYGCLLTTLAFPKSFSSTLNHQKALKSSYCVCVKYNKSSLRWYRETRHNKVFMLFACQDHFRSKISLVLHCAELVYPGCTENFHFMYGLKHHFPSCFATGWQLQIHFLSSLQVHF